MARRHRQSTKTNADHYLRAEARRQKQEERRRRKAAAREQGPERETVETAETGER